MSVEIVATYENIPTGSMANSTTTGNYATNYSQNFVNFNDFKTYRTVPKYATLEQGRNKLDGTFINLPANPQGYGYLSTLISNSSGNFSNNIVITRTYTVNYTSPGLDFEFDTYTDDHPATMNVKWYRGTTLLKDEDYTVDSSHYFCDGQVQAYNKVVITIGNMSKPNRMLKIFNIADGLTRQFYNDELENVEIIEQITNNNQALNINESNLKILPKNTTGVLFQRTLPFSIWRNSQLYGKFYIDTSTSNTNKTLYNLKVSDEIKTLESQTYMGGIYTNVTMATLIADIMGDIPYTLDSTAGAYTISGYLPILNKREALRQVAFCTNTFVDTTRSDTIQIKPLPTTVSRNVQPSEIINIQTTQENITTKIELSTTTLVTKKRTETDDIYEGKINGKTTTILFDNPMFNLTITGGTIVESNCNYAKITGTATTTTLQGKEYQLAESTQAKTNEFAVSTDIEKVESYETTLTCNNIDIMEALQFVEFRIKSKFKMGTTQVGDLINLNGETCRVYCLDYNLKQSEIYAEAEMEAYYG